ncbi:MAG: DUF86 domain-containing protein [Dongiaceae bacterium]
MTKPDVLDRLEDISAAIERIGRYRAGKSFGDYQSNSMLRDAVERNIERISEASRHLPDDLKSAHPEIPWRQIADIGNVLRHAYRTISDRTIWDTIDQHLAPLADVVRRCMAEWKQGGSTTR